MKTLFEPAICEDVVSRICRLQPNAHRQWGKMDAAQMLAHCSATIAMASGQTNLPRAFLGKIIGPLFKPLFVGEKEFRRNGPTSPVLVVADRRDFEVERRRLIEKIHAFNAGGPSECTRHPHPFFGNLSAEEWGRVMYKHLDHHLRQFGG
jgi:hypothetical protein